MLRTTYQKNLLQKTLLSSLVVSSMLILGGCHNDAVNYYGETNNDPAQTTKPTPNNPTPDESTPNNPAPDVSDPKTAVSIETIVKDEQNNPVSNAFVNINNKTYQTDATGKANFELSTEEDKAVLLIKKSGFVTTAKEVLLVADKNRKLEIRLFADQVTTEFSSADGIDVSNEELSASVKIPANAVSNVDGSAYTGQVNLAMNYQSPEELAGVQAFAQPYTGTQTDGNDIGLRSVGVIEIKLTDADNNPLQLNGTAKAELNFPANSVSADANSIPLWYYDETKKIWVENGVAYRQADGSYQGEVDQVNLWNLDIPVITDATIKGCFENAAGEPLDNIMATIRTTGWSSSDISTDGTFEIDVPANQPLELIPSYVEDKQPIQIPALTVDEIKDFTNQCYVVKPLETNLLFDSILDSIFLPINDGENRAPNAVDDNYNQLQGKTLSANVLTDGFADYDSDDDTLSVVKFSVGSETDNDYQEANAAESITIDGVGEITIGADGSLEFVAATGFIGAVPTITYTITDGNDATDSANVNIQINEPAIDSSLPAGSKLIGYVLSTRTKVENDVEVFDDLTKLTMYLEGGQYKMKTESVTGKYANDYTDNPNLGIPSLPAGFTVTSYVLAEDGIEQLSDIDFSSNIVNLAFGELGDFSDSKMKMTLSKKLGITSEATIADTNIANKSVLTMFEEDELTTSIIEQIDKLAETDKVFPEGSSCKYTSATTINKAHISFSSTSFDQAAPAGSEIPDNPDPDEVLQGTWAGTSWMAKKDFYEDGSSDAVVIYDGKISEGEYQKAGVYNSSDKECMFYNKDHLDLTIAAFKKAYPNAF